MYCLGIDLGGTNIAAGIVDTETGEILRKGSVPTLSGRDPDEVVRDMALLCEGLVKEEGLELSQIGYVGIGAPGSIDVNNGIVVYSNNLVLHDYPMADKLRSFLDVDKVYIYNDADVAALGEASYGAAKGAKNAIMITLGTGLGGGMIVNGQLLDGVELGHMVIEMHGLECTCGRRGCWESYSSATGLINMTKRALMGKTKNDTIMVEAVEKAGKISGRTAFDAYRAGDALGKSVVAEYIRYLSEGIINLLNVFRPEIIVIGGGICNEGQLLLDLLNDAVENGNVYKRADGVVPEIRIATLGNDAGIVGAAMLGL